MIILINWVFIYQLSDTLYSIVRYKAGRGCKYCIVNLWHLVIGLPSPLRAFFVESRYGVDELGCTARSLSLKSYVLQDDQGGENGMSTILIILCLWLWTQPLSKGLLFWQEPWSPRSCSRVGDDLYISSSRYSHY